MILNPNFGSYSTSNFYAVYQNVTAGTTLSYTNNNRNNGFLFDLVIGSFGFDPTGKITIFNNQNYKKIIFQAGDTTAVSTGSGYWLTTALSATSVTPPSYDTANIWSNVGTLLFGSPSFINWNIWVKRIG